MLRRPLLPLAAIAALTLCAAAEAQEPPPAAPPSHRAYNTDQMSDFARATVELQALGSQDPAAMTRAIQGAGMSVEDYNRMGDDMRADPALATSLNPYLDNANSERVARFYRTQAQVQPAARSASTASRKTPSHKAAAHTNRHGKSKAGAPKARHGKAASGSRRHASKKGASHAASTHKVGSKAKTHHAATPAHASKRHKRG